MDHAGEKEKKEKKRSSPHAIRHGHSPATDDLLNLNIAPIAIRQFPVALRCGEGRKLLHCAAMIHFVLKIHLLLFDSMD